MAKSTKVTELAASLNMDGQKLFEKINALGLGFSVKSKSSGLNEEQIQKIKQALAAERQPKNTSAIDEKSQSTATKGTVRVRRRKVEDTSEPRENTADTVRVRPAHKDDVPKEQNAPVAAKDAPVQAEVQVAPVPDAQPKEDSGQSTPPAVQAQSPVADEKDQTSPQGEIHPEAPDSSAHKPEVEQTAKPEKTENDDKVAKTEKTVKPESKPKSDKKDKKDKDGKKKNDKKDDIIELVPKFEKTVTLSLGSSFTDQLPAEFISDADEVVKEEKEEKNKHAKVGKSKRKLLDSIDEVTEELELANETEIEEKTATPETKRTPSNITGAIDPALIRAMLIKDNKKFGNSADKGAKKSGTRTVVNSSQFYGNGNQGNGKNAAKNNAGVKKTTKPQHGKLSAVERAAAHPQASEHKRVIKIAENITVGALANAMGVKSNEVIRYLMKELGMMCTVNQSVDVATAELVAAEYNFTVQDMSFNEEAFMSSTVDSPETLELRAPIVTVMGHVDHGKTSLLDAIRNSRVTATEAGGITQHIGASTIDTPNGKVVFLDTPGHEAFTALRARGAKVTDHVVLVVAADDGIMPQTVEAINHAKAAGVPIIVAINKIDKPGANPERVKQALTEYELIPEDWGGTTLVTEVSAKTGEGVPELLELIQLQSEVLELKANPDKPAHGFILEAYKDNRRGTVASILVQEGTLRINDILVSGACYGKVKSMINDRGRSIRVAEPSTPVEITGLSEVPDAGEPFFVAKDEKIAKEFTSQIKERKRNAELSKRKFDPWAQFSDNKNLNVIIKADVQGSLEALTKSLNALSTDDVKLTIVHSAVGGATENDVSLAVASNAIIVGFNTRPDARAAEIAKHKGVIIESFSIIYDIIDYVKNAMSGLLDPILGENVLGHTEIRNTFNVPKVGTIAGGYVTDGVIKRGAKCRLLRSGKVIYDSKIASLKRFKDDAKEVRSGFECGFSIENYNDVKVGDIVEVYEITETKQSL